MRKYIIAGFVLFVVLQFQSANAADVLLASGSVTNNGQVVTAGWVQLYGNNYYAGAEIVNGQYSIYRSSDQTWPTGSYNLQVIPDTEKYPQYQPTNTTATLPASGSVSQNLTLTSALKQISVTVLDEAGQTVDLSVHAKASGGGPGMGFVQKTSQGKATFTVRPEGAPYHITAENCTQTNAGTQDCIPWVYTGDPVTVSFTAPDDQTETQSVTLQGETPSATVTGNITYKGQGFEGFIHLYNEDNLFSGWMNSTGDFTVYAQPGAYKVDLLPKMSQTNPDIVRYYIDEATIGGAINVTAGTTDVGNVEASYESSTIHATVHDENGNSLEGVTANFWLAGGGEWRKIDLMPGSIGSIGSEAHAGVYYVNAVDSTGQYLPAAAQQVIVEENSEPTVDLTMVKTNAAVSFTIETADDARASTFNSYIDCWDEENQRGSGAELIRGAATMNLVAGNYTCTAMTPQNADASLPPITVELSSGETASETAALVDHDATVSGEILNQDGDAVEPATTSEQPLTVVLEGETYGHFEVPVEDDGSWSADLPPDTYTIKATGDELAAVVGDDTKTITVASGATKTDQDLTTFTPDSEITATVLEPDGKTPMAFAPVTCTYLPEGEKGDFDGGRVIEVSGETDANGKVTLDVVKKDGDQTLSYDCGVSVPDGEDLIAPKLAEVQPGAKTEFELIEPDATLTVNYEASKDLTSVQCQAWSEESTTMMTGTDDDGDGDVKFDVSKEAGAEWNVSCAGLEDDTWYTVAEPQAVTLTSADSHAADVTLVKNDVSVPDGMTQSFDGTGEKSLTVDGVGLEIPSNAIESDEDVTITVTPTATDLPRNEDNSTFGVPLNVQAFDSDGNVQNSFTQDIVMTIPYDPSEVKEAGILEEDLVPKFFDESGGTWETVPGYQIDTENKTITFSTDHFTQFGLIYNTRTAGEAPAKVKTVRVPGKNLETEQAKILWKKVTGATSYDVQLLNKKGKTVKTFTAVTGTSYVITKKTLDADMAYQVRVRAVGKNSLYSGWSKSIKFRTKTETGY